MTSSPSPMSLAQHKLLIANRGEIALRILRSAKQLGVATVSVYTETDATSKHVHGAEETVQIGSYTDQDELLKVAARLHVTLIHPGYGFLSENHTFAEKVEAAGITWLGPRPSQILSMGLKHEARACAEKAGVPILPGSELVSTLELATAQAESVGYPVMLKATGGGGGMGMEVCESASELKAAFSRTVEMTKSLFSNAGVFVEKYIPRARHIEIQVFGDGTGNVVEFGERECSVQRRHQKVLEEAGSPFIDRHPELGKEMRAAAVRLCAAIAYRSAGTVEFLVDDTTAKFYFLELNSRIQVEHAVTEIVRPGLDLVALMIKLGLNNAGTTGHSDFALPAPETFSKAKGHAIEARVYAEIPHLAFKPSPGLLQEVSFPNEPWLRVDSWVETGSFVSPFYDPMIAKVIALGSTREEARQRLDTALSQTSLLGTSTNLAYLRAILACPPFVSGDVTTAFLDTFPYTSACIEVIDGGLSTSVQDLRLRLSGDGIPRGGAMDDLAHSVANLLVGNEVETEALEVTMTGPSLVFPAGAVVGIAGATCEITVNDVPHPMWSRIIVPPGGLLELSACDAAGARVYIAVRGGFPDVPFYMGSKATFVPGKFGGVQGRDLVAGDIIGLAPEATPNPNDSDFTLPSFSRPEYPAAWNLAALAGPHADIDYLTSEALDALFSTEMAATADSNRLGIRLEGLPPLKFSRADGGAGGGHPSNTLDHGYTVGALNLNGDTPVLFTVDGPDAGGFACVLGIVMPDLWKLGQVRPGDKVRFVKTSNEAIEQQRLRHCDWLASVKAIVAGSGKEGPCTFALELPPFEEAAVCEDGIIHVVPEDKEAQMPRLSFRQSGDIGLLVEVGAQAVSFRTRVITELWERRIRALKAEGELLSLSQVYYWHLADCMSCIGVESFGQGAASLLLRFNPKTLTHAKVLELFLSTSQNLGVESLTLAIPARRVYLPVVFDDDLGRDTIAKYSASSGRTKAVYLPNNLEYLAEASGMTSVDAMLNTFSSTDWYVLTRAFFCGLPMMQPLDQRAQLASQKYNPSRTFTPAGTLGYAGSAAAVYPVDSPGGYQILGRTLTPWKLWADSYEGHFLLRSFDLIRWVPMSEHDFSKIERDFKQSRYSVKVEQISVSAAEVEELERTTKDEVAALREKQQANLTRLGAIESELFTTWKAEMEAAAPAASSGSLGTQSGTGLKSPVLAVVRGFDVEIGQVLKAGSIAARVEAMKTEIAIKVPKAMNGKRVVGLGSAVGDVVNPGQVVVYCV